MRLSPVLAMGKIPPLAAGSDEQRGWCLVSREPNSAGKARSLVVVQEGLQDGSPQDHPLRLGWTIEWSRNHLLRQIKGKRQGLPLMF